MYSRILTLLHHRRADLTTIVFWREAFKEALRKLHFYLIKVSEEDFNLNLKALEKRPWLINIELTNICNSNCIFCAYRYQARERLVMKEEVYQKALNEYCEIGGGELMLEVTVGEPTRDRDLVKRIREARSRKQITTIETITNGILLNQLGFEELLTSGITRIKISIAAFDEKIYEKIYRNKMYNRLRQNILKLLELNKELGEPVEVTLWFRSNLTLKKTLDLPDYQPLKEFPHKVTFMWDFDNWTGLIKQKDLLEGLYLRPPGENISEPCFWLYHGPVIFVDGKIGLCGCRDLNADSELIIGNIKTDRLIDAWRGEKVRKLRERFYKGEIPDICKGCSNYRNLDFYRTQKVSERRFLLQKINH